MQVRLISMTETPGRLMSPEQLISYTARVSNPDNQMNLETADRLIRYLIKNKHWSPFEMVDMTIEIKTSRAIAAQILRHRSFSFQEFSQRYAAVTEMEEVQLRKSGTTNRQSSSEAFDPIVLMEPASESIRRNIEDALCLYKELIAAGVAKECARMILPLTTQTTLYMKGSIRSWIHYLEQRCSEHTQLEHREIALEIQSIFFTEFPDIAKALQS